MFLFSFDFVHFYFFPKNVFLSALTVAVANLFSFYQQFPVNFINEFSYEWSQFPFCDCHSSKCNQLLQIWGFKRFWLIQFVYKNVLNNCYLILAVFKMYC